MTSEIEILQYLHYNPEASRADISSAMTIAISPATLKRLISDCIKKDISKLSVAVLPPAID